MQNKASLSHYPSILDRKILRDTPGGVRLFISVAAVALLCTVFPV